MFLKKSSIFMTAALTIFSLEAKYININSMNEYKKACSNGKAIIIMYSASWCQPCQFMKPTFSSLSRKHKDIGFYVVDTSLPQLNPLVKKNSILGLPTTVMYDKENKEIKRERGGLSKQELSRSIDDFVKKINAPIVAKKEVKATVKDKTKTEKQATQTRAVTTGKEKTTTQTTGTKKNVVEKNVVTKEVPKQVISKETTKKTSVNQLPAKQTTTASVKPKDKAVAVK